jgi:hypothetical protein
MARRVAVVASLAVCFPVSPALAQTAPVQQQKETADQNEKVCETITVTGSRLGKKRFCATRAEWEERRRLDRQEIEKAQRSPCVVDGTTCK